MINVKLIAHTPNPQYTVAAAAKLCYSASSIDDLMNNLTNEKAGDFVEMLAEIGHESPIEHASFTFAIEGVSRALLAQITRHRIASYSVQSQRYVKGNTLEFVLPPEIEKNEKAKEIYLKAMNDAHKNYLVLADILKENHIKEFLDRGFSEKESARMAEKKAIEDARFVLPNGCTTKMIVTMNARSLLNFFAHRCCNRAQWEIKELADQMLKEALEVAPLLFKKAGPPCVKGGCPEGKMTCGKIVEVREFYKNIL